MTATSKSSPKAYSTGQRASVAKTPSPSQNQNKKASYLPWANPSSTQNRLNWRMSYSWSRRICTSCVVCGRSTNRSKNADWSRSWTARTYNCRQLNSRSIFQGNSCRNPNPISKNIWLSQLRTCCITKRQVWGCNAAQYPRKGHWYQYQLLRSRLSH